MSGTVLVQHEAAEPAIILLTAIKAGTNLNWKKVLIKFNW